MVDWCLCAAGGRGKQFDLVHVVGGVSDLGRDSRFYGRDGDSRW